MSCKKICIICVIPARIGQKSVESVGLINSKEENLRHLRNLRDQTPAQIGLQEKKIPKDYLLCLSLQKKCHVLKIGSHRASAGKYLTSLISRYTLWRLCPSFDLPNRFLSSCFPKLPASSTSFSTNLPHFSFGGTIRREAGMPNTSCMIYMIPPANFHNPNSFNSFCTLSLINNKSSLINT